MVILISSHQLRMAHEHKASHLLVHYHGSHFACCDIRCWFLSDASKDCRPQWNMAIPQKRHRRHHERRVGEGSALCWIYLALYHDLQLLDSRGIRESRRWQRCLYKPCWSNRCLMLSLLNGRWSAPDLFDKLREYLAAHLGRILQVCIHLLHSFPWTEINAGSIYPLRRRAVAVLCLRMGPLHL